MIFKPGNFTWKELVSEALWLRRGGKVCELFTPEILHTLDIIRKNFNCPININDWSYGGRFDYRGFREIAYYSNRDINDSLSQHLRGNAFDFDVTGYAAEDARDKIRSMKKKGLLPFLTGIEIDINWVHIDCRVTDRLDRNGLFEFRPRV